MTQSGSISVDIAASSWPDQLTNDVFIQWCLHLATAELSLPQWSGPADDGSFTFGNPRADRFTITPKAPRSWRVTDSAGISPDTLSALISAAARKTEKHETGEDLVYQVTMTSRIGDLDINFLLHMIRTLGEQVRIIGSRRLSGLVLLDFEEEPSEQTGSQLFTPNASMKVTIFVPGPAPAVLTSKTASAMFETVAAICALALGRPVDIPSLAYFPLAVEDAAVERTRRSDLEIPGLARDSISLDIFGELQALGGTEAMIRARNALITMHEAQRQRKAEVSVMLYVCAIEALITPGPQHEWRKEQVTRRFREGVLSLCTDQVDALLEHRNLEAAFDFHKQGKIKWQRRQLVDRIYDLRSVPTHTGISPLMGHPMFLGVDHNMRVALLSDLARAAFLAYIQAPRSFLAGHPSLQKPKDSD